MRRRDARQPRRGPRHRLRRGQRGCDDERQMAVEDRGLGWRRGHRVAIGARIGFPAGQPAAHPVGRQINGAVAGNQQPAAGSAPQDGAFAVRIEQGHGERRGCQRLADRQARKSAGRCGIRGNSLRLARQAEARLRARLRPTGDTGSRAAQCDGEGRGGVVDRSEDADRLQGRQVFRKRVERAHGRGTGSAPTRGSGRGLRQRAPVEQHAPVKQHAHGRHPLLRLATVGAER